MRIYNDKYVIDENSVLNYYEVKNNKPKMLLLHAQGTDSMSFKKCIGKLSKYYHLYLIDYYGHGKSSHNKEKYNLINIGDDIIKFIQEVICDKVAIVGHSSGGLIAAYIAANCDKCGYLVLEDAPIFSSLGDRRYNTYNYVDLSTVCHNFISQDEEKDFVYYYFINQYCWNFFPKESREEIKQRLGTFALNYRKKNPDKDLKVRFWPKRFLEGFKGMNNYDPYFGEAFYNDSFNRNVDYEKLLENIKCETLFMKANTTIGQNGLVQGALTQEDLDKVSSLINNMKIVYFDCGHGIHVEKSREYIKELMEIVKKDK